MTRPTAARRGYDARWQAAIAAYKDIHPWCIGCWAIGVRRETEVVDHVVPHHGDPMLFWCEENWQSSCTWHHGAISLRLSATGAAERSLMRRCASIAHQLSGSHV